MIEINPWSRFTSASLFSWTEDLPRLQGAAAEFRGAATVPGTARRGAWRQRALRLDGVAPELLAENASCCRWYRATYARRQRGSMPICGM